MAKNRLIGDCPVIGIRPTIDGRRGKIKVRESLEDQTMNMAKAAAKLIEDNVFYSNGEHVKTVIADTTIGRVADRIKNGTIKVKGKTYTLQKNNGKHTLHGGVEGLSNQFFDLNVVSNDKETKVIFTYLSPHLEGGFPGNLDIKVVYTIF